MFVSQFLDFLLTKSYSRHPYFITIAIEQYDETYHTTCSNKCYVCHLSSYDEPSFKREGSAQPITLSATFIVDSITNYYNKEDIVIGQKNIEALNTDINTLIIDEQNDKFEYGNLKIPTNGNKSLAIYDSGNKSKDFIIDKKETDAALAKMHDYGYTEITRENLEKVQQENAKLMESAYNKFNELMRQSGYKVSKNTYNDVNHEIGIGTKSGSHLLGQKIDLTFLDSNNKKISYENMTDKQRQEIVNLAKQSGLTPNWETTGEQSSLWGDFALSNAYTIDKTNKISKLNTESWTGEDKVYNKFTKNKEKIGK